jgi:hypothetical protein
MTLSEMLCIFGTVKFFTMLRSVTKGYEKV